MKRKNKYLGKIIVLIILLIPQLFFVAKNWKDQMLEGNWVELLFLEFTIQALYHYVTKEEQGEEKTK